jgi:hypothetical protein
MEQYNNTRRWRCYEAALLMKKNEIRTDEEAPLTTPVDASVLEYYRASPEDRSRIAFCEASEILFRKREKAKAFFFFYKKNLDRFSCSIQYLSSVVKSNITGVYISTLSHAPNRSIQ